MLDRKSNIMYNLLTNESQDGVKKDILNAYLSEKSMGEVIKTFIDGAIIEEQEREDKDPISYMYLRMLNKIINGKEKYVKHVDELTEEVENEHFNLPASNIVFGFNFLKCDVYGKSTIANKDTVLVSLTGLGTHKLEEFQESEHARLVKLDEVCGDKVFSRDSIREAYSMVDYVLKRYPSFYIKLFKTPEQDIKKIIK